MRFRSVAVLKLLVMAIGIVEKVHAQDSRTVAEPQFPVVCHVVKAPLMSRSEQPVMNSNVTEDEEVGKGSKDASGSIKFMREQYERGAQFV